MISQLQGLVVHIIKRTSTLVSLEYLIILTHLSEISTWMLCDLGSSSVILLIAR